MNTIIQEVIRNPRKLESPQVRRRLTLALRCRECKKYIEGEHHNITCHGCVISEGRKVPAGLSPQDFFEKLPLIDEAFINYLTKISDVI